MSALDRRSLLKGGALAGAAVAVPLGATARPAGRTLVVFDSRLAESCDFSASLAGDRLDLATAHETQWADLRGALPDVSRIEGLTGWSDWVAVRGELEARGLRLAAENPVAAPLSGKVHLLRWSMKARSR